MIPATLPCVYSDSQIKVYHLREALPGEEIYDFFHARYELCLNASQPDHALSREWHTQAGNFFIISPNNPTPADEHYMLCPLFQFSHSNLIIGDADGNRVDHNEFVSRYPGLLTLFQQPAFVNATINWPMLWLHVPQEKKEHCTNLVHQLYKKQITDTVMHQWRLQLQLKIPVAWDSDDWTLAYRLRVAFGKDLDTKLQGLLDDIKNNINQDNIDFLISRKRIIRQSTVSWLSTTLVGRLLQGMRIKNDTRADVTQYTVIAHLVDCLDLVMADTIRTVVLEHHRKTEHALR